MKFYIQFYKEQIPDIGLNKIDRLNVPELINSFIYPIVWWYDEYISGWFPAEISLDFAHWLKHEFGTPGVCSEKLKDLPFNYHCDLLRSGLITPDNRISGDDLFVTRRVTGTVKIPSLFRREYVGWVKEYYKRVTMARLHDMVGISRTSINDHALMRLIHSQLVPLVQNIMAHPVKGSYSFTATYDNSSSLPRHTDRLQCVYNISLMFGSEPNASLVDWPLFVEVDGLVYAHHLEAGDAAIYLGRIHPHWRDKMPDSLKTVTGAFLHYVPLNFEDSLI